MLISTGKRLLYHLWDQDQHLKSPEERKLVRKLDFGILICATLGWWMKYIDQNNIVNAYVSGMKEDLNLNGNECTYMLKYTTVCCTIAFAIMQIPSNAIALQIRSRICIVTCELGWTVFIFAQAAPTSSMQMYAFRFMAGLFESGFYPIIIFLLGSWYTKTELAKRMAMWHITRFFVCGCMSLPVALSVWWLLPNLPHNTKAWYITEEDKALTLHRSAMQGKYVNSCHGAAYFAIYLRFSGYSVSQRNVIPACANLVSMVTDFIWSFMSDYTQNRVWWMVGPIMCTTVVSSAILTAWPAVDAARVVAFFLTASGFVTGITWTWANEINVGNAEERVMTISSMNSLFYATASFLPILVFPQTMAPKFERGFPSLLALALCACALILLAGFLHKRQLRQEAERNGNEIPIEVVGDKGEDGEKAT
ncbi:hypothetical protein S7711_09830 [Stachybotrys chartarum IBT 7711]|uniref:Major facilitator superfamily (MFS) profile domain-containing protein n=1 Tax=Stachybotrys chartarum (strain CBS 109288 / IBT 7711) TaxID=1280523 RepID=A0A084AZT3_STACB|nr:hypothetical protein S7711_09830 [Stachybotrys chartarum IBT 7711]